MGAVLDYKGVSFNEALSQLGAVGVAFDKNEMQEMHSFLLEFHRN
jgi:hypothetical protein